MKSIGRSWITITLIVLHLFNFISAVTGVVFMISDPGAELIHMPHRFLQNSPLQIFFVPGMVLFSVVGLTSLMGAILLGLNRKFAPMISLTLGLALISWIFTQIVMLQITFLMQAFFFGIGLLVFVFSMIQVLVKNEN